MSVLEKMKQRLQGGRFRWLNQVLYTTHGQEALDMVLKQPALYEEYHQGFREQTKGWPQKPVHEAISWLKSCPREWIVVDLGCGEAELSQGVVQKVVNIDLAKSAPDVIVCNMAHVPLGDSSVDAAVFCLSLMGTDYGKFVEEAYRLVKPGGWVWIAEVQSRFINDDGESVLGDFITCVKKLGFELKSKETGNSHFLTLRFQKNKKRHDSEGGAEDVLWPSLRACVYKKR